MTNTTESQSLIEEIDARQNEVLAQIDELNQQIESLLDECRREDPAAKLLELHGDEATGTIRHVNLGDQVVPISQSPVTT